MSLPNFISYVLVGVFSFVIFNNTNGILNTILKAFGASPINVYEKAAAWPLILVLINLWKGSGYGSIVYFAALMGMDRESMWMFSCPRVRSSWFST